MPTLERCRLFALTFVRSTLAASAILGAYALVAPGCLGASCGQSPHCKGNVVIDCLEGEDPDGPNTYNHQHACPESTTCTERTAGPPVCLPKKTTPCEVVGKQACLDGQPVECVKLDGGSMVLLPTGTTGYLECLEGETCAIGVGDVAICVSAGMEPCNARAGMGCSNNTASNCVELADGRHVLDPDYAGGFKPCPQGTTCFVNAKEDFTSCGIDDAKPCERGQPNACFSENYQTSCEENADGSFTLVANDCRGCAIVDSKVKCQDDG
jgi:hypothetical protein